MNAVNLVEKFGADGSFERRWLLPPTVVAHLRGLVQISDEGWVVDMWLVTEQIASLVQPYVDEPVDAASEQWFVSSEQA